MNDSDFFTVGKRPSKVCENFEKIRELWTAVYLPRMAPIGLKLCQHAFQTIPDVSFVDDKKIKILPNFCKFWTAVYLPRMAPIWLKLGQNAFQAIPDISYFDIEKFSWGDIFGRGMRAQGSKGRRV